ncbi:tetratricopeptide repeat protein [Flavobacterium bomense]|uniref:histidine kinase n=1 Tax=Flavobacterium bomense TaxID=2497483 RepID=A0A432CHW3_9FLAO|nr:tetratricopeptide repeat protein [Flavobacterium sp. LS1R10]RTZ02642.1 tetratricopeptide repeat protein [Flavobacterium bomense]RTZ05463.1 tetratricopeptide repeat protein [Flavobacterium sp. GSP6]
MYTTLFFIFLFCGCTQKNTPNKITLDSKDSLSTYFLLSNDFDLPSEQREKYVKKALQVITPQENDSLYRVNLFKIANRYYNLENWKEYKRTVRLVLEKSAMQQDAFSMAKGNNYLGDYYDSQGIPDSSFLYYDKAEKIYIELNDNYNLAKTIIRKANIQFNQSDFLGAEKAASKALKIIKNTNQSDILYDAYNLLGLIYNELEDYKNAMRYHNRALASIDDELMASFYQPKATSYNNIGYLHLKTQDYKQAKRYFQKGLDQKNVFKDKPSLHAMLLNNLAYSKFKLNEKEGLPDLFFRSLKTRDSLQLSAGVIASKINLSEYFISKNETLRASQFAKQALELSKKTNNYRNVLNSLKQLSIIEPQNAAVYGNEYIQVSEKLQKSERKMGNKFTRIEYETEEIKNENKDLVQQNRNLVYIFSGLAMLGLFSFVIRTQKAKNRELLFKQQQQMANEEIYNLMITQQNTIEINRIKEKKRVARELHDGVLGRLFGVRINLDSLNKIVDGTAVEKRNNYLIELKNIEQDIREISHDLNREKSELINNFVAIVDNLFEDQKKTHKSKLISSIDPAIKWELVSNSLKINLYRILQEALQNSNKYANANTIKIELRKEEDHLILKISDNGVGFNIKTAKKGIGLQNILFRTKECDGIFDIQSSKKGGTIITVTTPIE